MKWIYSPNFWVGIASLLGVLGIVSLVGSAAFDVAWLKPIGFILLSPIVVGGVLLVMVGIPILIVANRRAAKNDSTN